MSVVLRIPTALRTFTDRRPSVEVEGRTVAEALAAFVASHPDIRPHLYDNNGELRPFVNVYLGDANVKTLGGPGAPLADGDVLTLVPTIAGGAEGRG